ncbi:MAG: hypothetical protein KBD01_17150 [Acidobacteria bacterium]|nr:hypothetical protein [Acidobacteriota bacterium]
MFLGAVLAGVGATGTAPAVPGLSSSRYTSADGLLVDDVQKLLVDREGFVWAATSQGLSIYDGERFTNFTEEDGLAGGGVFDVAQAPDGAMWVATGEGLFRIEPSRSAGARPLFERVALDPPDASRGVHRVVVATDGTVWAGTFHDLVRIQGAPGAWRARRFELPAGGPAGMLGSRVQALAFDGQGNLWVGTHASGLFCIAPGGSVEYVPRSVVGADFVRDFAFDADGRAWVAFDRGVARFERGRPGHPRVADLVFGVREGLTSYDTSALLPDGDGRILVGSTAGITSLVRGNDGQWATGETVNRAAGLGGDDVTDLAADAAGNLWVGLRNRGLVRRAGGALLTHPEIDRPGFRVVTLFEDAAGRPSALLRSGGAEMLVWQRERETFVPHAVRVPAGVDYVGWLYGRNIVQQRDGSWWIGTGRGLLGWSDPGREGAGALARPPARWLRGGGELPADEITFVTEDSRADLWIGTQVFGSAASGLARIARGAGRVESFPAAAFAGAHGPIAVAETRSGTMWFLFFRSRLFRSRGRDFEEIASPLFESTGIASLALDRRGRLWLPGDKGVLLIGEPDAPQPRVERVALPAEIGATSVACAVDDAAGNVWLGTEHGVLRLDGGRQSWRLFTAADGLPGNVIQLCARDRAGRLWFSDLTRVASRDPGPDPPEPLPRARLREVRVAGEPVPLPPLGAAVAGPVVVPPGRSPLAISFFAVHTATNRRPLFQVRLGDGTGPWEAPGPAQSVHYARLGPGSYRFEVRAAGADGLLAGPPAGVEIRVLAPVWRRGWFLALCAAAGAAVLYAAYRLRLARVVEVERVRTRIATDLHDDIGSSLSQIAILAQLACRQVERGEPRAPASLDRITELAGEVVEAMSDVVWAISPRGDRVDQLASRMRRFASELFAGSAIELHLDLPPADGGAGRLDADGRRQIYLIFKEALQNALRHSGASRVDVELRRDGACLTLRVRDDGRGLPGTEPGRGHGLASIRRRAARIGAELEIGPGPGGGVAIVLRTGTRPRRRFPFIRTVGAPGPPA